MRVSSEVIKKIFQYIASIAILAASFMVFSALLASKKPPEQSDTKATNLLVETQPVSRHSGAVELETSGLAVPFREISMSAEVAGRVSFKSDKCKAGIFVKKGTKLIEVDSEEYALEVERANAELKQAESQIVELKQEMSGVKEQLELSKDDEDIQQAELDRLKSLGSVVSSAEVNQARRALLSSQNARLSQSTKLALLQKQELRLESGKTLAETKLKTAQLNERRAKVVAPSDGVIVNEMVEKDDFVQRGTALFAFEDTSAAEVKINLRPDELQWILDSDASPAKSADKEKNVEDLNPYALPQLSAKIKFEFEGGMAEWNGNLSRYEGIGMDESTRTVPVRVLVKKRVTVDSNGAPKSLVRGTFVKVKVDVEPKVPLLKVPAIAVNAGDIVWSVRDGRLKRHQLEVVGIDRDENGQEQFIFYQNDEAPMPTDEIVVSPLVAPLDGLAVEVVGAKTEAAPNEKKDEPVEDEPVEDEGGEMKPVAVSSSG